MKVVKISALWCSSCVVVNNYWHQLSNEYPNIEFIDYDLDFDEEEVKEFSVGNKLPEIIIFKDDKEIKRIIGEVKKEELIREMKILNEEDN